MTYLFLMTLAGTILFLLYFVWARICRGHVSERMKYAVLVVVMSVHLIPLMGLRTLYRYLLSLFPRPQTVHRPDELMHVADVSTATEAYVTPDYRLQTLIVIVWTSLAILLLLRLCSIYLYKRFQLKKVAGACRSEIGGKIVERLQKEEFNLKRKIDVLQIDSDESPYTIGVFKPVVVLTRKLNEDELEWALRHELTHIKQGDVMFKLLLELVCCLYWFNPTLHWFKKYFLKTCEFSCDAGVVNGRTEEERGAYSKVLTKIATRKKGTVMSSALADDNKIIQERINLIMNSRKMKRWEKIIAVSVLAVFILADSLVAFAYPNTYHVDDVTDTTEAVVPVAAGDGIWTHDSDDVAYDQQVFEVLYDVEFIDKKGTITPVNDVQPTVFCPGHNWEQGYVQTHEKDGNGGCTVKVFNAKKCPYCNSVVIESLYSTTHYVTCPH